MSEVIDGQLRDLGGFSVRRVLPSVARRQVGPFLFLDEMGPHEFLPGQGIDVRPHPHIGLATVTYLFAGEMLHRDSLGSAQVIRPGDINWMSAGRGIVHSERTTDVARSAGQRVHGLQLWVALPTQHEEGEPWFRHWPAATLPEVERDGVKLRVLAGTAYGETSPVETLSSLFYVDAQLPPNGRLRLPDGHDERAAYVVEGAVRVGDQEAGPGRLVVVPPDAEVELEARSAARVVLLGGEALKEKRHLWWNLASSRPELIERAAAAWRERRFPTVPGDETEFTPAPSGPPQARS